MFCDFAVNLQLGKNALEQWGRCSVEQWGRCSGGSSGQWGRCSVVAGVVLGVFGGWGGYDDNQKLI